MSRSKTTFVFNKQAISRLDNSKMSDTEKGVFKALLGLAKESNADDASYDITWHGDVPPKDNEFVPVLTMRVVRYSEHKKQKDSEARKEKRNPKKHFSFKVKTKPKEKA